jgi:DNA-binding NarL/FixJ family response regulator
MDTIQLAIANTSYATALRELLTRNAAWRVLSVDLPDPLMEGVIVLDAPALERLPSRIGSPERVVLITRNDPGELARAWEAGIVSVVFDNDPMSTAMLAIMAARLQAAKAVRQDAATPPGSGKGEKGLG